VASVALTSAQAGHPDPLPVADHANCIDRCGYAWDPGQPGRGGLAHPWPGV